jgi:hypothetical protein
MHKYAKPLTGYLEDVDFKKLDRVKDLIFSNLQSRSIGKYKNQELIMENL